MIFAKLDVSVYSHRRFAEAGFEAVGYWALLLAYLRHQESEDGFLPSQRIGVPLGAGCARKARLRWSFSQGRGWLLPRPLRREERDEGRDRAPDESDAGPEGEPEVVHVTRPGEGGCHA